MELEGWESGFRSKTAMAREFNLFSVALNKRQRLAGLATPALLAPSSGSFTCNGSAHRRGLREGQALALGAAGAFCFS